MHAGGGTGGGSPPLHILVTVTFNENQLRSHLLPILALPEVARVTLVSDVAPSPLPKVRCVVPPRMLARALGRAGAKLALCLWLSLRERPDWIVGFNFVPHGFNARTVAALTRRKSLYHMIGGEREWRGGGWSSDNSVLGRLRAPSPLLERLLLRLIAGCTAVATMGESGRAALLERGVARCRIRVIPPSVDTKRFEPSSGEERRYDIVTVGQLIPRKRTADLIRAVAKLREYRREVKVAIVGTGYLEDDLRRLSEQLGLDEEIDFLGFREDVEAIYRDARAFVLTSTSEGLPISMLEAMATGLPVVVSDVDEIGGFVRNGENGFTFPAGEVAGLASCLRAVLDDSTLRETVGAAAARRVREAASVETVTAEYRDLFLSESAAPASRVP